MRLASKHGERQNVIVRADFSGGLNTAMPVESIAENQLADCINVEIDHSSGKLRTVAGCVDILMVPYIFAVIYDSINNLLLIVKEDKKIYVADFEGHMNKLSVGKLTGTLYPKYTAWENGVLIASGGKLQYFDGIFLKTLDSPKADEVFVRAGRVLITFDSTIHYSAVGDETLWNTDSNVDSASKWVEVGYKDGGKLVGIASLSNNILVIKNNRRCYRLFEEFSGWRLQEIATNIDCYGRRSYCDIADDVFILNQNEAYIVTNNFYGNTKPEDVSALIHSELHKLKKNTPVKFLAPLNQAWCLGENGFVLVFDITLKAWFKRQFNANVIDVFSVGEEVYVVKPDRISKLDRGIFSDNDCPMSWRFLAQRLVSHYDYLLKKTRIQVTPLNDKLYSGQISVVKVVLPLPIPKRNLNIFHNKAPIYRNKTKIDMSGRNHGRILPQAPNDKIFCNDKRPYQDKHKIYSLNTYEIESRNVFRSHYLDIEGHGTNGGVIIHSITMDIAEV